MNRFSTLFVLSAGLLGLVLVARGTPAKERNVVIEDSNIIALSMEISALQVLHDLRVTPPQIELIAKLVKETAEKMPDRKPPKVSEKMLKLYADLRQAFIDADDDKINEVTSDLEDLRDGEKVEIDDDVDLTDAARKKADELLNKLTARQVAIYLSQFADEFPDPLEKLTEALDESRLRRGKEWTEYRDQTAGHVAWLVGGLEKTSEEKVRDAATNLLDKANKLSEADFKTKKKDLEKECRGVTEVTMPMQVMKNFMNRTLAELLSNPRTAAAIQAKVRKL